MKRISIIITISVALLLCFTNYIVLAEATMQTGLTLEKAGEIDTESVPTDLQIIDDIMYVAEQGGLLIFDISDTENPVQLGEIRDSGTAHGIHVVGDYAFIADLDDGLEIYDLSTFTDIQKIETHYPGQDVTEVLVQNSLCFISVDASKLIILNSTDVLNLMLLGEFNITSGMHFQYINDLLFIADYVAGLIIQDISDPTEPLFVSRYEDGENVRAVNIDNDLAYISCSTDGFKIIDISDIANPTLVCEIPDVLWGMGHIKHENLIYVCDYDEGLRVFDVSNPNSPLPYGIYESERVFKVFMNGEYLILLKGGDGMIEIVKITSYPITTNIDTFSILITGGIGAVILLIAVVVILKKRT